MSLTYRYPKWRYAEGLPVFRTLGGPTRITRGDMTLILHDERREYLTPVFLVSGVDFMDADFTLDVFDAQTEGWALDVTCPCGEPLTGENVGRLLRNIYRHCGAAGHPMPGFDR